MIVILPILRLHLFSCKGSVCIGTGVNTGVWRSRTTSWIEVDLFADFLQHPTD